MGSEPYEMIVVGAGMIGSAAARHIAETNCSLKLALVGPRERQDKSIVDIHGAHYDEGRLTRCLDPDPVWGVLAARSIKRYRELEKSSGVPFYVEVGGLAVGPAGSNYLARVKKHATELGQHVISFTSDSLKSKFPYMMYGPHVEAAYTPTNAGHISPRNMVRAQQVRAGGLGCDIVDDVVADITSLGAGGYKLTTDSGRVLTTKSVLVATGSFTAVRKLLPGNMVPSLELLKTTVLLVEITGDDLARMKNMPSVTVKSTEPKETTDNFVAYILPPIKYPDGKYYLKIGHGNNPGEDIIIQTPNEIHEWYCYGKSSKVERYLMDLFTTFFPDVKISNYKFDRCVVAKTPNEQVFVDLIANNFGVALGGCGYAAKSSDEIGRMAARMIMKGEWDHDLPAEVFKFKAKTRAETAKL